MQPSVAKSPSMLREANARHVLAALRADGPCTVTTLMAATELTRATVLAVCDDLCGRGWAVEVDDQRASGADYSLGRPARRFDFNATAGLVLGVSFDASSATCLVTDARGRQLVRNSRRIPGLRAARASRVDALAQLCAHAVAEAGAVVGPRPVLTATIAIPAPIDRSGSVVGANEFWRAFDLNLVAELERRHGWSVRLENDANLAALAERWRGAAQGSDDVVVLMAGERIGAGVVVDGRVLHGAHGGVGEFGFLRLVEGVGSPEGMTALTQRWQHDGLADDVIQERLVARMARVVAVGATLTNPELVVLAGDAHVSPPMLAELSAAVADLMPDPPRLAVSPLGADGVVLGAVRHGLDYLDAHALELDVTA